MSPPQAGAQQQLNRKRKRQNEKASTSEQKNATDGRDKSGHSRSNSNLDAVFERIVARRQKEINAIKPESVKKLLMDIQELTGAEFPSLLATKPSPSTNVPTVIKPKEAAREVRNFIASKYKVMRDVETLADQRRRAHEIVSKIFALIDTLKGQGDISKTNGYAIETRELNSSNGNDATSADDPTIKPVNMTSPKKGSAVRGLTSTTDASINVSSAKTKKPVRTVASLSSASALTTATAACSNNNDLPAHASNRSSAPVPPGTAPPPYQKRSPTAQEHEMQKKQKQQQNQRKDQNKSNTTTSKATVNSSSRSTSQGMSAAASRGTKQTQSITNNPVPPSTVPALVASGSSSPTSTESSSSSNIKASNRSRDNNHPPATKSLNTQLEPKDPPIEKLIPGGVTHKISQLADNSKTSYCSEQPQVELQFQPYRETENTKTLFQKRLGQWDPFWVIEKSMCTGFTAPITKKKYFSKKEPQFSPQTAARFTINDLISTAGPYLQRVTQTKSPADGERRVLIRMLPYDLSKQKNGGKHRADAHLWPKGTYLQISTVPGKPTHHTLQQRKQQPHDASKWLGICRHLDVTSLVLNAWELKSKSRRGSSPSIVELSCYDPQIYMFSLALCRYRSPTALQSLLLQPNYQMMKRVSLIEMHERAKKLMDSKEVVLDDDSDNDQNGHNNQPKELRSIRFSIRDPITMAPLKVPVRGTKCRHVSCFELNSFLEVSKPPSGQRWKCPHCELFLSYVDLEHCALTEQASKRFGNQITNLQHMVEYREDKTMALCKPIKSHQERARARKAAAGSNMAASKNATSASANEVVELLDSDSD